VAALGPINFAYRPKAAVRIADFVGFASPVEVDRVLQRIMQG